MEIGKKNFPFSHSFVFNCHITFIREKWEEKKKKNHSLCNLSTIVNYLPVWTSWINRPAAHPLEYVLLPPSDFLWLFINYTYRRFSSGRSSLSPPPPGLPHPARHSHRGFSAPRAPDQASLGTCCLLLLALREGSGRVLLPSSSHSNWHGPFTVAAPQLSHSHDRHYNSILKI